MFPNTSPADLPVGEGGDTKLPTTSTRNSQFLEDFDRSRDSWLYSGEFISQDSVAAQVRRTTQPIQWQPVTPPRSSSELREHQGSAKRKLSYRRKISAKVKGWVRRPLSAMRSWGSSGSSEGSLRSSEGTFMRLRGRSGASVDSSAQGKRAIPEAWWTVGRDK